MPDAKSGRNTDASHALKNDFYSRDRTHYLKSWGQFLEEMGFLFHIWVNLYNMYSMFCSSRYAQPGGGSAMGPRIAMNVAKGKTIGLLKTWDLIKTKTNKQKTVTFFGTQSLQVS